VCAFSLPHRLSAGCLAVLKSAGQEGDQGHYLFTGALAVASLLVVQEQKNEKVITAFTGHYD